MKRKLKWLLLSLVLLMGFTSVSYAKSQPINIKINEKPKTVHSASVLVNGFPLECKFSPYVDESRTFVPIREITELMGARVQWNQKTRSVNIELKEKSVKLKIDSNVVYVDGKKSIINKDSIPRLVYYQVKDPETKTMVPLRFLSESLGFAVNWDGNLKQASISNGVVEAPPAEEIIKDQVQEEKNTSQVLDKDQEGQKKEIDGKSNGALEKKDGKIRVVVDPGHGGKDSGAVALDKQTEKALTLKVANILVPMLESRGYDVLVTRTRDEYIGLYERGNLANENKADIFISIHFNSFSNEKAKGIEVLYASEEDVSIKTKEQKLLAQEILTALLKETGADSRGIKNRPELAVLRRTSMPAALAELGFLSNPSDLATINSSGYLDKLARGIANGIDNYSKKHL